jgi:hypothetical protein
MPAGVDILHGTAFLERLECPLGALCKDSAGQTTVFLCGKLAAYAMILEEAMSAGFLTMQWHV